MIDEAVTTAILDSLDKHRISMRGVRDPDGTVIGYYERYEPPAGKADR
jgi:hypothetical protein